MSNEAPRTEAAPISREETSPTSSPPVVVTEAARPDHLKETDLLKLQLTIAHLGMAKQAVENAQLKLDLAQRQVADAEHGWTQIHHQLEQDYGLKEGESYNFATGEISHNPKASTPPMSAVGGDGLEEKK